MNTVWIGAWASLAISVTPGREGVERRRHGAGALGKDHQLAACAGPPPPAAPSCAPSRCGCSAQSRAGAQEDVAHQAGLHDAGAARQAGHQQQGVEHGRVVGHQDQAALVAQGVEATGIDAHHAGEPKRRPRTSGRRRRRRGGRARARWPPAAPDRAASRPGSMAATTAEQHQQRRSSGSASGSTAPRRSSRFIDGLDLHQASRAPGVPPHGPRSPPAGPGGRCRLRGRPPGSPCAPRAQRVDQHLAHHRAHRPHGARRPRPSSCRQSEDGAGARVGGLDHGGEVAQRFLGLRHAPRPRAPSRGR